MLDRIFRLFGEGGRLLETFDAASDNNSCRSYIVRYRNRRRLTLRTVALEHETAEKIEGQAALIEHYCTLGIDCPRMVKSINGKYCEKYGDILVFAVECRKFDAISDCAPDETARTRIYRICEPTVFSLIGRVAAHSADLVPWHTPYCLYEPFSRSDSTDENYECASTLLKDIFSAFPACAARAAALFAQYCREREAFRRIYEALPCAVFQGNIQQETVLVTPKGRFRGFDDFSLSGTETILNYAFCESFEPPAESDIPELLLNRWSMLERDRITAQRLAWIGKEYHFTDAERAAFQSYYHIVAPFRWPCFAAFRHVLAGQHALAAAPKILDWIEFQMTRTDVLSLLPQQ